MIRSVVKVSAIAAFLAIGCGSPQRSAPLLTEGMPGPPDSRLLFETNCHHCHPQGGAGLGPPLNNKPLPKFAIKAQVRQGLGVMPAFSKELLSEDDLQKIAQYVQALRKTK